MQMKTERMNCYPHDQKGHVPDSDPGLSEPGSDQQADPLCERYPGRSPEPQPRRTTLKGAKAGKHRHNDRPDVKTTSKERPLFTKYITINNSTQET